MEFDLNILIEHKLSFEAYFIMFCLYNKKKDPLRRYTSNCRKIPNDVFDNLEKQGMIKISGNREIILYEDLELTDLGKNIINDKDNNDYHKLFEELRLVYPKKTRGGRVLHLDLKRCEQLYKKILKKDITLHDKILKSAKLYHNEKLRTNSEEYMQNLASWLNQANYEHYFNEDVNILEGGHGEDI